MCGRRSITRTFRPYSSATRSATVRPKKPDPTTTRSASTHTPSSRSQRRTAYPGHDARSSALGPLARRDAQEPGVVHARDLLGDPRGDQAGEPGEPGAVVAPEVLPAQDEDVLEPEARYGRADLRVLAGLVEPFRDDRPVALERHAQVRVERLAVGERPHEHAPVPRLPGDDGVLGHDPVDLVEDAHLRLVEQRA